MNTRITPDNITELKADEIFVFGSNEAGKHGAGAAKQALLQFGAIYGRGLGLHGQSWAIPTKDKQIRTLPLEIIQAYVRYFSMWAEYEANKTYLVTKIGCGLAGWEPKDIAPLFRGCVDMENVYLPKRFWEQMGRS